jgi:hypothetical protein
MRRHQKAISAYIIVLTATPCLVIILAANGFEPNRCWLATKGSLDGPRPRQRIIDHRHLVVEKVRVRLIEVNSLLMTL